MSLENDIFNNPLEAFPEFIDDPVAAPAQTAVAEPVSETPAEAPVENDVIPEQAETEAAQETSAPAESAEPPKKQNKYIPSYSSASYIDPLDTVEEADLDALSSETAEYSFGDESDVAPVIEDAGSVFTKTNYTLGSIEYEDVAVKPGAELYDIDDSVPDAAPETEEVSIDDFLSDAGSGTEEVDLDAFLGDSGFDAAPSPVPGNATEEVSLDDFGVDFGGVDMAAIDAFAASSKQEKSDIENAPAIEMDLEFDDDFVLETKANPEDDIDFDFEALMAGESVNIPVPESTGDETLDNFDDIFDNIVDEGAPATSEAPAAESIEFDPSAIEEVSLDDFGISSGDSPAPSAVSSEETVAEQQIVYDEVSEFDDLLSSFSDDTHVEVADNRSSHDEKTGPHDYNIIVVMEDEGEETVQQAPAAPESSDDDEDYEISLFKTEEEADHYRKHDSSPASQGAFNETPSVMDQSLPVSGSGSFEDISLDDFGVTFEDETPAAPETSSAAEIPEEEPSIAQEDIPEEEPDTFMVNGYDIEETPVTEDIPDELETTASENDLSFTECEDTTPDDKIIVELSEECVYNGDKTEHTSNMIDGNNEEITDTMDSMNEGLLEKIVSELSVLRNEMQTLRDEVQTLKGGEPSGFDDAAAPAFQEEESVIPEEAAVEEPVFEEAAQDEEVVSEDIPVPEADPFAAPQEAGGFFSGDDDDETIALSGDELNNILNSADFTQEDGSNFGMEAPEGSVIPDGIGDDFAMDAPAEETVAEEPAFDAAPADDFSMDISAEEPASEDAFTMEAPAESDISAEEPVSDDFSMDIPDDIPSDDIPSDDIPVDEFITETPDEAEASAEETPAVPETEELSLDDFDTDLPSLKDEAEPAAEEAAAPAEDDFSLDEFDIPEPSVEETSIADIDIDEPDEEPKAEEEFSLDEFDIPEPSVEETSIADIDIDEPSSEIPSDESELDVTAEPEAAASEDSDFYENSDTPAIPEEDISSIGMQESLEEPVLDDIDFSMDEPQSSDIDVPTGESLVVDSSSTDFLEEDDPTLDEQLTSEKVDYLNEEAAVDDLGALPEVDDIPAVEGMEDSLEADTIATSEDETPADDMFSSQWDEAPAEPAVDSVAEDESEEEFVQAAKSFDDPIGFDIEEVPSPAEEAPAEDFSLDEPENEIPAEEPVFEETPVIDDTPAEEPAPAAMPAEALSGDIKQEVKSVLKYMDQLLENLPEDKIAEFAQSEHFETYKKLFNELGLV